MEQQADFLAESKYTAKPINFEGVTLKSKTECWFGLLLKSLGWGFAYEKRRIAGKLPDWFCTLPDGSRLLIEVKGGRDRAQRERGEYINVCRESGTPLLYAQGFPPCADDTDPFYGDDISWELHFPGSSPVLNEHIEHYFPDLFKRDKWRWADQQLKECVDYSVTPPTYIPKPEKLMKTRANAVGFDEIKVVVDRINGLFSLAPTIFSIQVAALPHAKIIMDVMAEAGFLIKGKRNEGYVRGDKELDANEITKVYLGKRRAATEERRTAKKEANEMLGRILTLVEDIHKKLEA